jgi:bifunctional non-homologous end joining protein LigD
VAFSVNQRPSSSRHSFPGFIEPALASTAEKVPNGERWLPEIKFDGYRVQLHIANA